MKKIAHAFLITLALSGCATGPNADPRDPLEPFNRGVYQFNDSVDRAVLKPVATVYQENVPSLVRRGVNNFFGNLEDAWSFVNNTLQLKGAAAGDSFFRFGVNTLLGLGGVLDVASEMRIEKHTKDFGHTLGYWGVKPGPYLVLPLLGSSSVRDALGRTVDAQGDIVAGLSDVPTRNSLTVLNLVDTRANLLKATAMLDEVALDKYTFTRDAYLQRRRSAIYDGNPPEEESVDARQDQMDVVQTAPDALNTTGLPGDEKVKP
jgi:phospholipid-binding lipoprotein MlaA